MDIRLSHGMDVGGIYELYQQVAKQPDALARNADEITLDYVSTFSNKAQGAGYQWVAVHDGHVVGELHAYPLPIKALSHVLGELTLAVHPLFQGKGVGKALLLALTQKAQEDANISRIELFVRASNTIAQNLYLQVGFKLEGKLYNRILNSDNIPDTDMVMGWVKAV